MSQGEVLVLQRLGEVRRRLAMLGAAPGQVKIVAVTKGLPTSAVASATAAGLRDLGESYAAELLAKARDVGQDALRWHFLGAVQRNKVKALARVVELWHSVTRQVEGEAIARGAPGAGVLVQVEVADRPDRRGVVPASVASLVAGLRRLDLEVRGLMALGRPGSPEATRSGYRRLAAMGRDLGLAELSMGMSEDFEIAVEEGSTMVRLGSALFGHSLTGRKLEE